MLNTLLDISEESTGEFDKTQIERLFLDLFIAGNDTTSAALEWTMAELIHNPERDGLFLELYTMSLPHLDHNSSFYSIARSKVTSTKLPPGPKPFPIIGNLLELVGHKPQKSMAKLANTHGPLMTLKLGQKTTIVISSADLAKEVLQQHDQFFCNHTIPESVVAGNEHEFSLPWLPVSAQWRNLRRICKSHLFANQILDANQNLRRKKVQELLADIHNSSLNGDAVDIGKAAFKTSLNLLSNTIFSVDLADPNSATGRELSKLVHSILEVGSRPNLADYFPVLKKVDFQGIWRQMTIYFGKMIDLFSSIISQWLLQSKTFGSIRNNDMLDTLFHISEEKSTGEIDKTQIERLFVDLFLAGNDTTSATLEWAMAELLYNPEAEPLRAIPIMV
ncbi:hypothetical protein CMV_010826 [Castanea mollissima]|uniref:Cytochrome P450 n=1 Tax=Castanea mollissima TaxID=60419 RepID=A0A8J4RIJ4_9ROSI|nr:hypothetical protein CMV_010826 [Castanea mollissima]